MTNYTARKMDENGQYITLNGSYIIIKGNEETLQRVRNNIKVFKGQWFRDPDFGFDFYSFAGQKGINKNPRKELERTILETEGIKSIEDIQETINRETGTYSYIIKIAFDDGQQTTIEETI